MVAIVTDVCELPAGKRANDEARYDLVVEAALDDANKFAISALVEVSVEVSLLIAHKSMIGGRLRGRRRVLGGNWVFDDILDLVSAMTGIDIDVGPANAAAAAEIEARPAHDRLWRRCHVCCKCS